LLSPIYCLETNSLENKEENIALFYPPSNWEYAPSDSEYVLAAFVSPAVKSFRASINIAKENTDLPLEEYVSIVLQNHRNSLSSTCVDLGYFPLKSGKAKILQIASKTKFGDIKMIQLIISLDKEKTIYIMTGAATKEDFPSFFSLFVESFRSFSIEKNLFSPIQNPHQRKTLINELVSLIENSSSKEDIHNKEWKNFEKNILQNYKYLGNYWQLLILKKATSELIKKTP
jgi:hypothetical protein